MNPWDTVLPAVVVAAITSVVTTLITTAVVRSGRAIESRKSREEAPLLLKQRGPDQWLLQNRTSKAIVGMGKSIQRANGTYEPLENGSQMLWAKGVDYLGALQVGDIFSVNWMTMKRGNPSDFWQAEALIKANVDEYLLTRQQGGH